MDVTKQRKDSNSLTKIPKPTPNERNLAETTEKQADKNKKDKTPNFRRLSLYSFSNIIRKTGKMVLFKNGLNNARKYHRASLCLLH